jgi:hypothetical protein
MRVFVLVPLLLLVLVDIAVAAPADGPPPFTADRPGYSQGSSVVGQGVFQIEAGVQQEFHQRYEQQNITYLNTLLRLGVTPRLELRVEGNTFQQTRTLAPPSVTWGFNPTGLAMKYQFQDQPDGVDRPSMGVVARFVPATGSGGLRPLHAQEDAEFCVDYDFAPHWQLTTNIGAAIFEDDSDKLFGAAVFTFSLNRDITDRLGAFAEIALQTPEQSLGRSAWIFDYGLHYMTGPDTQLDVSAGHGLGGFTAPDFFWSVGISQRWR